MPPPRPRPPLPGAPPPRPTAAVRADPDPCAPPDFAVGAGLDAPGLGATDAGRGAGPDLTDVPRGAAPPLPPPPPRDPPPPPPPRACAAASEGTARATAVAPMSNARRYRDIGDSVSAG